MIIIILGDNIMTPVKLEILFQNNLDKLILERAYRTTSELTTERAIRHIEELISIFKSKHPEKDDRSGTTYIAYISVPIQPDLSQTSIFATRDFRQFCQFITYITAKII